MGAPFSSIDGAAGRRGAPSCSSRGAPGRSGDPFIEVIEAPGRTGDPFWSENGAPVRTADPLGLNRGAPVRTADPLGLNRGAPVRPGASFGSQSGAAGRPGASFRSVEGAAGRTGSPLSSIGGPARSGTVEIREVRATFKALGDAVVSPRVARIGPRDAPRPDNAGPASQRDEIGDFGASNSPRGSTLCSDRWPPTPFIRCPATHVGDSSEPRRSTGRRRQSLFGVRAMLDERWLNGRSKSWCPFRGRRYGSRSSWTGQQALSRTSPRHGLSWTDSSSSSRESFSICLLLPIDSRIRAPTS